jgi:L-2,4-diaminobutyric acid acetyltransferase
MDGASPPSSRSPSPTSGPDAESEIWTARTPDPRDAAAVWRLVRGTRSLDLNSPYAYLLLCSDFAATSLVAEAEGELLGFVAAYRPPPRPWCVFVWQIVTAAEARGAGLAGRLLDALFARPACRGARFLEATVTPSNTASRALFRALARRRGAPFTEEPAFGSELFPNPDHEEEVRVRIGPLPVPSAPLEER